MAQYLPHSDADFTPDKRGYKRLHRFKYWCQSVLPLVYDDSLSYYEVLCKVVDFLNKTMEDVNILADELGDLHQAFIDLQEYVNNYFNSIDYQAFVDDKIDRMVEDGTLSRLLYQITVDYLDPIIADIRKNIAIFEANITNEWNEYRSATELVMQDMRQDITNFTNNVNKQIGDFRSELNQYKTDTTNLINQFINDINSSYEEFKTLMQNKYDVFVSNVNSEIANFKTDVNNEISSFETTINNAIKNIQNGVDADLDGFADDIDALETSLTALSTALTKLTTRVETLEGITYHFVEKELTIYNTGGTNQSVAFLTSSYSSNSLLAFRIDYTDDAGITRRGGCCIWSSLLKDITNGTSREQNYMCPTGNGTLYTDLVNYVFVPNYTAADRAEIKAYAISVGI